MIIEIRAKNSFAFEDEIRFSMKADMRIRKFSTNVHRVNDFNILKTVGIYGPNNAGKTCLIKCIRSIKHALLNKKNGLMPNIFSDSKICVLGVTFIEMGRKFTYDFKYDLEKEEYVYEYFAEIFKDQYGNESEECWLKKDTVKEEYQCADKDILSMIPVVSKNSLLCYLIDTSKFKHLDDMKNILVGFAGKIDIINMNNIPMTHTIELMKNKSQLQEKIVEFIKNSDLYMDNFEYVDMDKIEMEDGEEEKPEEKVLDIPEIIMEQIRLVSTYKGVHVPSMIFDSTGTKKIAAIASYVIEALENGRILVVDELDSSIHFKLTRAIVAMFNNELNSNAQMVFTVHDVNLMDCKKMFRKEQIWFVHKDESGVYVYSLADFTAEQGVRGDSTDIIEKYRKGALGALPDPELINSLLSIKGNAKEIDAYDK